jgi:hypothetical protein
MAMKLYTIFFSHSDLQEPETTKLIIALAGTLPVTTPLATCAVVDSKSCELSVSQAFTSVALNP